jgi:hypothetical protein
VRSAVVFLAACLFLLAAGHDAQAAGRWRAAREARRAAQQQFQEQQLPAAVIRRPPISDPREIYPQYQGGFHSRALQNIGVPTGDIGIRGNGFMMNPW